MHIIFEIIELFQKMNLTTLQTFLTIVKTGSLVRASQQLNVTQSTVTSRLKSLEEELGQTLVHRHKSGVRLTAAGGRLRHYAETMTQLWRQAQQETALPDEVSAVCNIGCDPDLWPHLGETLFDNIRTTCPDIALSIWHGGPLELTTWLNSGLIDVSLTYQPTVRDNQSAHALVKDKLLLVSTQKDSPIKFDPGYVYVEAGEEFGRLHAAAYADANTARLSFGSATLGLNHILKQGGTAYLPERMVKPFLTSGTLHHLTKAPQFQRNAFVLLNDTATKEWHWLKKRIKELAG